MARHGVFPTILLLLTARGAVVSFGWAPTSLGIGLGGAPRPATATAGPLAAASSADEGDGTHVIEAWLATHLPTLSASDLQDYAARLRDDGFTSAERLNGINAGESGMLEDLYFMKKGHRRTLMKKMGIVRAMRRIEGNRIARDGDDDTVEGDEQTPDPNQRDENRVGKEIVARDTSIEDWLLEQSRMVDEEKRRLAELLGEDRLNATSEDAEAGRDGMAQTEKICAGNPDGEEGEEVWEEKDEAGDADDIFSNEGGEELFDDLVSRYNSLNVVADDNPGTASKQARRVEELKRDFMNGLRSGGGDYVPIMESEDADMNFLDDFVARYRYLDLASREDCGKSDKEARRLEDLKQAFLNRLRAEDGRDPSAIADNQDVFLLDDFVARYQSLGVAPREDVGTKDKGARRLEDLKQVFLSRLRSKEGSVLTSGIEDKDKDLLDDFVSRYQRLDMASRGGVGMGDKEAHRLEELKSTFIKRLRANGGHSSEGDDVARYQSLDALGGETGIKNKEARRLGEPRQEFLTKMSGGGNSKGVVVDEETDLVDDFLARYQPLDMASRGDEGTKEKETRRLEEMRRSFFNGGQRGRIPKTEESEDAHRSELDDFASRYDGLREVSTNREGTAEKERRRLEAMKRAFLKSQKAKKSTHDAVEEPLRLDLLKQAKREETAVERKERMRVEEFRRLASVSVQKNRERRAEDARSEDGVGAKKPCKTKEERRLEDLDKSFREARAARRLEEEKMEKLLADAKKDVGDAGSNCDGDVRISRRTRENRRLEELEESFRKRREARIAEEERMERMLMEVKMEAATDLSAEEGFRSGGGNGNCRPLTDELNGMEMDNFFDKRRLVSRSLSTTMPPTGVKKGKEEDGSSVLSSREIAVIANDHGSITPLSDQGAIIRPLANEEGISQGKEDVARKRIDEECWDITRNGFSERMSRSLATTLPPANTMGTILQAHRGKEGDASEGNDEPFYDITRNLFPQISGQMSHSSQGRTPHSMLMHAFTEEEKLEMKKRSFWEKEAITRRSFPDRMPINRPILRTQSAFMEGEKSEMNDRRPPDQRIKIEVDAAQSSATVPCGITAVEAKAARKARLMGVFGASKDSSPDDVVGTRNTGGVAAEEAEATSLRSMGNAGKVAGKEPVLEGIPPIATDATEEVKLLENATAVTSTSNAKEKMEKKTSSTASNLEERGRIGTNSNYIKPLTAAEDALSQDDTIGRSIPERQPVTSEGEKTGMTERKSSNVIAETKAGRVKAGAPSALDPASEEKGDAEMNSRASALYQKFQSNRRQSVFSKRERSEMNGRLPPSVSQRSPQWSRVPSSEESPLDTISRFPGDRPPMSASGSYEESKKQRPPSHRRRDDAYVDLMARFPDDRPSMSVNTGTKKVYLTSGSYKESKGSIDEAVRNKDSAFVDITQTTGHFAGGRPSTYVNTVPSSPKRMKTPGTRGGSHEESKNSLSQDDEDENYVDLVARFPDDRPSMSVNTGTKKVYSTAGSYEESKESVDEAVRNKDGAFTDITQSAGHFSGARPSAHVNTGTKKRETGGSYGEGYARDIAHNFSQDRASLMGQNSAKNRFNLKSEKHKYLDKNPFSSSLYSGSRSTAAASTNAIWRDSGKDSKYLDTPRAFAKDLDMAPPSIFEENASKKRISIHTAGRGSDVVDYLDVQAFSSNLRSWTATPPQKFSLNQEESFLDKPRPFLSNVDMVSSNTSGARFKRSSDVPPEEKHIRDHYDITPPLMPDTTVSRRTKSSNDMKEELFTDITRAPLSTLERTSSAVKDANSASKTWPKGAAVSVPGSDSGQSAEGETRHGKEEGARDPAEEEEESSFSEIMYWILTHLPHLQEEDAIAYFNNFLEDGFDSIENLEELMEEDLHFMKEGHRRVLIRSIQSGDSLDLHDAEIPLSNQGSPPSGSSAPADELEIYDIRQTAVPVGAPDASINETNAVLEKTETSIAEQNNTFEEKEGQGPGSRAAREKRSAVRGEPFKDITRSSFVERPSLSLAAPASSITRDSSPNRPSLATHLSTSSGKIGSKAKLSLRGSDVAKKRVSAPRAELNQWYIEKGFTNEQVQRIKDFFTVWNDGGKAHESKFTCVFTCPMSGEHFACGSWKLGEAYASEINWYKTKKQAINAAAAKALDCFSLRECHGTDRPPKQRCFDAPYLSRDGASFYPTAPTGISLPTELIQPDNSRKT